MSKFPKNRLDEDQFVVAGVRKDGSEIPCLCAGCVWPGFVLDDEVEIGRDFSSGWKVAPVCSVCKLSLPVFLEVDEDAKPDGARAREDLGDDRVRQRADGDARTPAGGRRGRNEHGRFDGRRLLP